MSKSKKSFIGLMVINFILLTLLSLLVLSKVSKVPTECTQDTLPSPNVPIYNQIRF